MKFKDFIEFVQRDLICDIPKPTPNASNSVFDKENIAFAPKWNLIAGNEPLFYSVHATSPNIPDEILVKKDYTGKLNRQRSKKA